MQAKPPVDDSKYLWTMHVKYKLIQYNLGPNVIKRIIKFPERTEEGVATNTIAVMKSKGKQQRRKEIWVMFQRVGTKKKIISAWIYPGESPKGKELFIPDDVLMELEKIKEESKTNQENPNIEP